MDEDASLKIPSRIVLKSSSTVTLSDRFRKLRQSPLPTAPQPTKNRMSAPRGPSNRFLYDDYMDTDLYAHQEEDDHYAAAAAPAPMPARGSTRRTAAALDMELDSYAAPSRSRRGAEAPVLRRRDVIDVDERGGGSYGRRGDIIAAAPPPGGAHARRFADALGIPAATRIAHQYDDVEYGIPQQRGARPIYRELPTARIAPLRQPALARRRAYADEYDDLDVPGGRQEVIEVVERVRRVPRRIQVVKKVPIQSRVVKKIYVQPNKRRSGGGVMQIGFGNKRRSMEAAKANRGPAKGGAIPKRKGGGRGTNASPQKRNTKPKIGADELDKELDEYMRGTKHPRI